MAFAIKKSAGLDHQTMGVNLAGRDPLVVNLHLPLRKNSAIETAGDDYVLAFNLTFDASFLAKDQRVCGNEKPFDLALDAKCSWTF